MLLSGDSYSVYLTHVLMSRDFTLKNYVGGDLITTDTVAAAADMSQLMTTLAFSRIAHRFSATQTNRGPFRTVHECAR